MRVLHLLWDGHAGGTQRYVNRLVQSPDWHGIEHGVALFANPGVEIRESMPYPVWSLGLRSGFQWGRARRLRSLVGDWQADVLHLHCDTPAFLHQAGLYRDRRIVYTEHGDSVVRQRRQLATRALWRLAAPHIDLVLLNSGYSRRVFEGRMPHLASRCRTFPNPLLEAPPARPERAEGPFRIGAIGRLDPVKGFDRLLSAVTMLDASRSLEVHVYGDGPQRNDLERQAATLTVPVRFHGYTDQPLSAIGGLDLLVVPSRREAFGLTVLEAQAMGTPVIANRVDGLPERVEDGVSGLLCNCADPGALASAIGQVMGDPARARKLAEGGRATASRQGLRPHLEQLAAFYGTG